MNLKTEQFLYTRNLVLRDANVEDSEFIALLRTDQIKSKFLSKTSNSIDDQRRWMCSYAQISDQAYFIIESKIREKLGCVRIYNPNDNEFEWGSWLIIDGAPPSVALESALAIYDYAKRLGFEKAKIEVRRDNKNVWMFHEKIFGAVLIDEDELNRVYMMDQSLIERALDKYRRFLN